MPKLKSLDDLKRVRDEAHPSALKRDMKITPLYPAGEAVGYPGRCGNGRQGRRRRRRPPANSAPLLYGRRPPLGPRGEVRRNSTQMTPIGAQIIMIYLADLRRHRRHLR